MATSNPDQPQITLYRGEANYGKHAWSPFVIKLETRLRLGSLAYKAEIGSMVEAPKSKIPYVRVQQRESPGGNDKDAVSAKATNDKSESKLLADSTLTTSQFIRDGLLEDLNTRLDPVARAQDLALRALLEDKFYFLKVHETWTFHYPVVREHILNHVPYLIRLVLGYYIYRNVHSALDGQGTGRLTNDEIRPAREEIWESIALLLQIARDTKRKRDDGKNSSQADRDSPFWVLGESEQGSNPSEVDATLFGFVASILVNEGNPQCQTEMKRHPVILDYARRIQTKYFPDYESWE